MNFQQLKEELDKGKKRNFYVFTGDEKEVMQKYIRRIDQDFKTIDNMQSLVVRLQNRGLFDKQNYTFVIRNDESSSILEWDLDKITKLIGKDCVILTYDKVDERKKFFKNLKPVTIEFKKFTEQQLVWHIQKFIDVPDKLAVVISMYCNNEVARIEMECHKLAMLGKPITLELINELIQPPFEDRIFEMIDAVVKQDRSRAWELFSDLKNLSESPIKIISILYTKLKQTFLVQSMFQLSNVDIAAKTGLTIYQVNQTRELCGKLQLDAILENMRKVQNTEVAMKTGLIDIDTGTDKLLLDILNN